METVWVVCIRETGEYVRICKRYMTSVQLMYKYAKENNMNPATEFEIFEEKLY